MLSKLNSFKDYISREIISELRKETNSHKRKLESYITELKENLQKYIAEENSGKEEVIRKLVNIKKEIQEYNKKIEKMINDKKNKFKICKELNIEYFPNNYNFDIFYEIKENKLVFFYDDELKIKDENVYNNLYKLFKEIVTI
jgi:oligoendopeptidase F